MNSEYDVCILGAGSGGFGAAYAAAREGLQVLLVERLNHLGGNIIASGVTQWEPVTGGTGIPFEIYTRLRRNPRAVGIYGYGRHMHWPSGRGFPGGEFVCMQNKNYTDTLLRHGGDSIRHNEEFFRKKVFGVVFEPISYEIELWRMLHETGYCDIRTRTTIKQVTCLDGRIETAELSDGSYVRARYYIDATQDGVLAEMCNCQMLYGHEAKAVFNEASALEIAGNDINGVSLMFRIRRCVNPKPASLPRSIPKNCWWRESFPIAAFVQYPNGDFNVNPLVTMEGAEYMSMPLSDAKEECIRRTYAIWRSFQESFDEFLEYRLIHIFSTPGVRESKRVSCEYMLSEDDITTGISHQDHPDIIAVSDHAMDVHSTNSRGCVELDEPYGIPFRSLQPKGMSNLLMASRASGFSSIAASSCRLSRTMMQLGQAAGTAAVIASRYNRDFQKLPVEELQHALLKQHVQLGWPCEKSIVEYMQYTEELGYEGR